ncbi:Predicted oxidoreductase [Lentzea xinjiangensis]|uniref:Predicted oxidoreductase n=1 Tax=Lentzea xinjiangensis TaxID=402600 RepID=A0A1H9WH53_9PSEU|nr:aldo/keto reductase [Lentzea xinjiangensis]SES33174.1 Predicted oxidoreductase [Lentzea xinjiangensis]
MKYKTLGDTGLIVSQLCLGTMTFSGGSGVYEHIGEVDQSGANELVRTALDGGVNFLDTADVYSGGQSEATLGQAFRDLGIRRHDYVIATKVYSRTGPGRNDVGASRGHIMDAVEASLRRLRTDHIDLYQIHATDRLTPLEETLRALDDLVRQGKVRYVGVSNWNAWRIAKALGISDRLGLAPVDTVQSYYSPAGRDVEREIVPLLDEERLGLLVWSPLAGGLLPGKFSRDEQDPAGARRSGLDFPVVDEERAWRVLDVLGPIARDHGCTPARVALAWLLTRPAVTSVLIGARRLTQIEDNLAAVDVVLGEDEIRRLDEVSELPPEYPGWMLDTQGADRWEPVDLWGARTAPTS